MERLSGKGRDEEEREAASPSERDNRKTMITKIIDFCDKILRRPMLLLLSFGEFSFWAEIGRRSETTKH